MTNPGTPTADKPASRVRFRLLIAGSRRDRKWMDRFKARVGPVISQVDPWDDVRVLDGNQAGLQDAIEQANAVLLLVSKHMLDSDLASRAALPSALEAARSRGIPAYWVLISQCRWRGGFVEGLEPGHDVPMPLAGMEDSARDRVVTRVCRRILPAGVVLETAQPKPATATTDEDIPEPAPDKDPAMWVVRSGTRARPVGGRGMDDEPTPVDGVPALAPAIAPRRYGLLSHVVVGLAVLIACLLVWAGTALANRSPEQGRRERPKRQEAVVKPVAAPERPQWAADFDKDEWGWWSDLVVASAVQRFRYCPAGDFTMGSPAGEAARDKDEQLHPVSLTRGFWIGDCEVTQVLWDAVMPVNPSKCKGPYRPVEGVSWDDCQTFVKTLNRRVSGLEGRLLSDAEWEYACRAGTQTPFSFGANILPAQVNYDGTQPYDGASTGLFRKKPLPVKSLPPNPWGLYDMHGNVWEWCRDAHSEFALGAVVDPLVEKGPLRVLRGGSWGSKGDGCRSAYRLKYDPSYKNDDTGLRLAAPAMVAVVKAPAPGPAKEKPSAPAKKKDAAAKPGPEDKDADAPE